MTTFPQPFAQTSMAGISPEFELLLCCARTCPNSKVAERIRTLLREDIDWARLIDTSLCQGTTALLYWNLNALCPEAVPKSILGQLRIYFHANALRTQFLTGELLKLLNLFKAHGIPAIPFKGPVLAASVYGNLSLRQFYDLDILLHERYFLRAKDLLITQGFKLNLDLRWQYEQLDLNWELHLMHEGGLFNVDLHKGIVPKDVPLALRFERLWSRLEPVSLAGATVPNLLPEDLLIILCVQVTKDFWERSVRLSKVCDIAELIRIQPKMNWAQVIQQSRTLGIERMLFLGLLIANDCLGIALPKEISQRIQADPLIKRLALQMREHLFGEAYPLLRSFEILTFNLKMRKRWWHKVHCCLNFFWMNLRETEAVRMVTPNEKDRAFLPLPAPLFFLYYFVRPIRLARDYGLGIFKHLQRLLKLLIFRN